MSDDKTTPDENTQGTGDDKSLPENQGDFTKSADSQRSDVPTQQPAEESKEEAPKEDSASDEDKELKEWAEKQGIDFDNPSPEETRKLAKRLRDTQGKLHDTSVQASELKKQIGQPNEDDEDDGEQEALMSEMRLLNFYASNPEARQYDPEMAQIYAGYLESDPIFADHLRRNIGTLFNLAKAESAAKDNVAARQQGGKDALKSAERKQASSAPDTNATKSDATSNKLTADKIAEWTSNRDTYEQHREEILAWEKKQVRGY